jgi:hypothetical protein
MPASALFRASVPHRFYRATTALRLLRYPSRLRYSAERLPTMNWLLRSREERQRERETLARLERIAAGLPLGTKP